MRTDNVTIGELTAQMVVEAKRLDYSEVSIWHNWMPRVGIVTKYYREQGLCVYDPAVADEFLQEITRRCEAGKVSENYFRKMRQITKRLNEFYLTGTLRMDVTLHGTKYVLSSRNERLVDLFVVSHFGTDLENMIRLKVSLGGAESTYLDRAQNFDRFCLEKYPDADCLAEPLALSWIKDAGAATGVILSKLAFERGFATYLISLGKSAYVLPDRFASGRSIFAPYIFTDSELSTLFREIDAYQYPKEPFRPILLNVYFRLTYTCGLRPNEGRTLKKQNVDLNTGKSRF